MSFKQTQELTVNNLKATAFRDDDEGDPVELGEEEITGDYIVFEYCPEEPSNYVWTAYCVIGKDNYKDGDKYYEVDADDLWRNIDPEGAKRFDIVMAESELESLNQWLSETSDSAEREKIQGYIKSTQEELDKLKAS